MVDPVRCLPDTRDRPIPSETQEEMVTRIPNLARLVRVDSGNMPTVTDPEGFAALLRRVPGTVQGNV